MRRGPQSISTRPLSASLCALIVASIATPPSRVWAADDDDDESKLAAVGLGGAGLQLRGMPTRDTLVLTDGLPLLGAEPDAFGILQTPPLDLERVEVIKGAASALYGGSALGGVLNLVSHTADAEPAVLANLTSQGGQDLVGFFTHKNASPWSGTLTAGAHNQSREDLNGDGWAGGSAG